MNVKMTRIMKITLGSVEWTHSVLIQMAVFTASVLMVLDHQRTLLTFQLKHLPPAQVGYLVYWANDDKKCYGRTHRDIMCFLSILCFKTSTSVWRALTCVDPMQTVLTQSHTIPAFVLKDSFPLLEWKGFATMTMWHVEVRCLSAPLKHHIVWYYL